RQIGREEAVKLAVEHHLFRSYTLRHALVAQARGRRERHGILALNVPSDLAVRRAVVLFQNATHPHIAGGEASRPAEPLAAQVRRGRDPALRIDEHEAMPEPSM